MAYSWRTTVLADRHRALGSKLEDWIGMPTAWVYDSPYGIEESYVAIRTKAGLMDVSGLKKVHLTGPHASGILEMISTRDVTKITPGKCVYTTFLNDAGHFVEDGILDGGKDLGIVPASFMALDLLRVESYLLFYPFDMSEMYPFDNGDPPGDTLWELGLDFTVSPGKTGFRGADAHWRAKGKERFKIFGVLMDGETVAQSGDEVWSGGQKVGVITIGMYSPLMKQSMALARLSVPAAVQGPKLEIRGADGATGAIAHDLPFYDFDKKKRIAVG